MTKQKILSDSSKVYNTIFDFQCRELISTKIQEEVNKNGDLKLLVVGSPDCKELSLLDDETTRHIELFSFDSKKNSNNQFEKRFKSCEKFTGNFFVNVLKLSERSVCVDFVINRWFLHHCNTEQKLECFNKIRKVLKKNGKMVMIDWFIQDYHTQEELKSAVNAYYEKHQAHGLEVHPARKIHNLKNIESPNSRGGKFTSIPKINSMLAMAGFTFTRKLLCEDLIEDAEIFGLNYFECENKGITYLDVIEHTESQFLPSQTGK